MTGEEADVELRAGPLLTFPKSDGTFRAAGLTVRGPMPWWDFDVDAAPTGPGARSTALCLTGLCEHHGRPSQRALAGVVVLRETVDGGAHLLAVPYADVPPITWRDHATMAAVTGADTVCSRLWCKRDASTLRISPREGERSEFTFVCAPASDRRVDERALALAVVYTAAWSAPDVARGLQTISAGTGISAHRIVATIAELKGDPGIGMIAYQPSGKGGRNGGIA